MEVLFLVRMHLQISSLLESMFYFPCAILSKTPITAWLSWSNINAISERVFVMILSELFRLHFVLFIVVRITLIISWLFLFISVKCSSFSKSGMIKLAELNRFNITCQAHGSYDKLVFEKGLLVSVWKSFVAGARCNTGHSVDKNFLKKKIKTIN